MIVIHLARRESGQRETRLVHSAPALDLRHVVQFEANTSSGTELNGHKTQRLANTSNITFHGIESEALLILLDKEGICASSGSACLADSDEPSHVIKAMKPDSTASQQMIRFSLDAGNSQEEIREAIAAVQRCVRTLDG